MSISKWAVILVFCINQNEFDPLWNFLFLYSRHSFFGLHQSFKHNAVTVVFMKCCAFQDCTLGRPLNLLYLQYDERQRPITYQLYCLFRQLMKCLLDGSCSHILCTFLLDIQQGFHSYLTKRLIKKFGLRLKPRSLQWYNRSCELICVCSLISSHVEQKSVWRNI